MVYLPWRRRPSNLSKLAPPPAEEHQELEGLVYLAALGLEAVLVLGERNKVPERQCLLATPWAARLGRLRWPWRRRSTMELVY